MNAGRSDASTSTDDVKGRPLCLFYFTHPFGVLSPEAPRVFNMEPASFCWPSDSYAGSSPTTPAEQTGGACSAAAAVRVPACRVRDSFSSSVFSSELWLTSDSSSEYGRRALPYARILPPLRVPSPLDFASSSEDVWPCRRPPAHKFSLPPISLPMPVLRPLPSAEEVAREGRELAAAVPVAAPDSTRDVRGQRRRGVNKHRRHRRRAGDLRRVLACLMTRAIAGVGVGSRGSESSASPALRRVLHTLRDAWAEPASLADRSPLYAPYASIGVNRKKNRRIAVMRDNTDDMTRGVQPRPDASPGLLRRRYSVPETIMRKYRLAQQCSTSDDVASCTRHSASSACASPAREPSCSPSDSPHRFLRHDRELMRKSALLRRLWARPAATCRCCEVRSLAGSRSELPRSQAASPPPPPAWTSPKRQRMAELSDSTYQSHGGGGCSCADTTTFTDSEPCCSETPLPSEPPAGEPPPGAIASDDRSFSDSDPFSTSMSTAKETTGSLEPLRRDSFASPRHIEGQISERPTMAESRDRNLMPYDTPLSVEADTSPYDLLEIVVSETVNGTVPAIDGGRVLRPQPALTTSRDINIDEYVSNILVESLNSLTDQIECMNASIGTDRKISIVEKEIKVKLQNTGVNTIVHLSPTSNNQIIFGNEELCNEGERLDECNNPRELLHIRDEFESNNNPTSGSEPAERGFDIQHENVNKAVLQQIQKLFQDEFRHLDDQFPTETISHIEISNVDVFIDERPDLAPEVAPEQLADRLISGVGTGNYFHDTQEAALVPRFSAFPHTDSMEVNTSSSEDAEIIGSDCTSLVDSLDDPNSPRSLVRGRGGRRAELVRSAIDVLDLLPEELRADTAQQRDKGEAFFVRIKDDICDHDKDDVKVAEYMPEKIKQRLYRRHRKREMRMECARRGKVKQLKKELEERRQEDVVRSRREVDGRCFALVDELLDEVMLKILRDEYKCMRIKQKNNKLPPAKSDENLCRRTRRKDTDSSGERPALRPNEARLTNSSSDDRNKEARRTERNQIHGKLLARPSFVPSARGPRRIYQKSEIHDGDKCIEILEILEYVNGSQSSPETTNSDESPGSKGKKSRIPVPVFEKTHRSYRNDSHMRLTGGDGRRSSPSVVPDKSESVLADMLLEAIADECRGEEALSARRTTLPTEPRSRSNSLRFKRVFDIIPEERSSLSLESSAEEADGTRRASAPEMDEVPTRSPRRAPAMRTVATSPPAAAPRHLREQVTMTSPHNKSAATSPLRPPPREVREVGAGPEPTAAPTPARRTVRTIQGGTGESVRVSRRTARSMPREAARPAAGAARRKPPPDALPTPEPDGSTSDSGDSGGSLLCSLAPRWLSSHARQRRRTRRPAPPPPTPPPRAPPDVDPSAQQQGGWSVTVAGSCRAALPHDVEMRLRFPHERGAAPPPSPAPPPLRCRDCSCVQCASCASRPTHPALPPASRDSRVTLTMKKEAQDSSIVASKSTRNSAGQLPELETYRASRSKTKSSVKTRRGYSLHCWLPDDEPALNRGSSGLSVLGCAIIPELKPRVPTMSERDLTRVYTPRHYLRS